MAWLFDVAAGFCAGVVAVGFFFVVKEARKDLINARRTEAKCMAREVLIQAKREKEFEWWHIAYFEDKVNEMISERLAQKE